MAELELEAAAAKLNQDSNKERGRLVFIFLWFLSIIPLAIVGTLQNVSNRNEMQRSVQLVFPAKKDSELSKKKKIHI